MQTFRTRTLYLLCVVCLGAAVVGCANSPELQNPDRNTTMLSSVDLVRMTDEMAESFVASDLDLSSMVIATDRVVNRTAHIMPVGERKHFLVRLRMTLSQIDSLRDMGVAFVASPEELSEYHEPLTEDHATGIGPTHMLTSTFRTITRVGRYQRDDIYECGFQLQDMISREIIWEDAYVVRYVIDRGPRE